MKVLAFQFGLTVVATLVAGLCCALGAAVFVGDSSVVPALAAAAVSLVPGMAVIVFFHLSRPTVSAILVGTLLRLGLTIGAGGCLPLAFGLHWSPAYFLSLGVVYLANLAVETWLILEKIQQAEQLRPSN